MMNQGDLILMSEFIKQLKEAQQEKADAEKDLDLWMSRMKLAKEASKPELFEAARERARRVRDELLSVEKRIMDLEVQKKMLKKEVKAGRANAGNATVARTRHLVESLKGTAMDPTEAKWERMEKESDAKDALADLKSKMGLD